MLCCWCLRRGLCTHIKHTEVPHGVFPLGQLIATSLAGAREEGRPAVEKHARGCAFWPKLQHMPAPWTLTIQTLRHDTTTKHTHRHVLAWPPDLRPCCRCCLQGASVAPRHDLVRQQQAAGGLDGQRGSAVDEAPLRHACLPPRQPCSSLTQDCNSSQTCSNQAGRHPC